MAGSSSQQGNGQVTGYGGQVQGSGSDRIVIGLNDGTVQKKGSKSSKLKLTDFYQPEQAQRETFQFVYNERYRQMRESQERMDFMKKVDKWEKQWEGFRADRQADAWQSNHVTPLTLSVVEAAISELVPQNMRPFLGARGPADQPKVDLINHVWDYAWKVSDSDLMMYDVIKDMLINGISITQEYYKQDTVLHQIPHEKNGKITYTKEKSIAYDDVYGEIVKIQDFFPDELGRAFDGPYKLRDCIRRYIMNIEDFQLMYVGSKWDQFDAAKFVTPGGDIAYYEFYRPPEGIDATKQVEVLHYWAEKPYDRWVIIANNVVVRDGENPYKHKKLPFARAVDVKRVHHFYAKGEPELLESIQDESNTLRRMIIDRNHLDIDKMFLVSNKLGLTDEDTMARPHGIIPTDDVDSAKAIEYGDIPRSVELSQKALEDDAVTSTGINPRQQSLPEASTATEASLLKESALKRLSTKLWLLRKEYLVRIGRLRLSNIMQFYSQPTLEKICGKEEIQQYESEIAELKNRGVYEEDDATGDVYKKLYRTIPIKKKKFTVGDSGQLTSQSSPTDTFFQLDDKKYFEPIERGGYDVTFESGANIDISKPLMQQKHLEMFDRFSQIATQIPNTYDIVKLGDIILRDNDINPDDVKPEAIVQQETQATRLQMQIQLADMENQMMMKGNDVPATPYAAVSHTLEHVNFMHGPQFQQLDNTRDKVIIEGFAKHVVGEMMAQESRNQQGVGAPQPGDPGAGGQQPPPPPAGPGMTPPGQPLTQGGAGNGMINRPGGMAQPQMNSRDVMPLRNPGGGK